MYAQYCTTVRWRGSSGLGQRQITNERWSPRRDIRRPLSNPRPRPVRQERLIPRPRAGHAALSRTQEPGPNRGSHLLHYIMHFNFSRIPRSILLTLTEVTMLRHQILGAGLSFYYFLYGCYLRLLPYSSEIACSSQALPVIRRYR